MVKHGNVSFLTWEKQVPSLMDEKRRYLALVSAKYLLFPSTRDGTSISMKTTL